PGHDGRHPRQRRQEPGHGQAAHEGRQRAPRAGGHGHGGALRRLGQMALPDGPPRQERRGRRAHRRLAGQVRHRGGLAAARRRGQQREGTEGHCRRVERARRQSVRAEALGDGDGADGEPALVARFPSVLLLAAVLAAGGGAAAPVWAAAKTDVVVLRSGDTVTGEVTELDRGRLTFKTDDIGTLAIEWDKVRSVTASATFEVHELGGGQYFGTLSPGPQDGELSVVLAAGGQKVLPLWRVVKVERLGATVWQRLDGSVDAGVSYTSSSELLTLDLATRVVLTRPGHELSLDGSSTITRQPDADDTSRNNLTLSYRRRRPGHWAGFAQAQAEQNKELG